MSQAGFDVTGFAQRMVGPVNHVGQLFPRVNDTELWKLADSGTVNTVDELKHAIMAPITLALSFLTLRANQGLVRSASAEVLNAMYETGSILPCSTEYALQPLLAKVAREGMGKSPVKFYNLQGTPRPLYMMFQHETLTKACERPHDMLASATYAAVAGELLLKHRASEAEVLGTIMSMAPQSNLYTLA